MHLAALAIVACPLAAPAARAPEQTPPATDELIARLAAPKYVERYAAQRALAERGLAAFDSLLDATRDPDPEVAAASTRLLRAMTVSWTRPGDTPAVLRQLEGYGRYDEAERRGVIRRLSLMGEQAVAALCRIARFDPSEAVSREAALLAMTERLPSEDAALPPGPFEVDHIRRDVLAAAVEDLAGEYGKGRRPAVRWLTCFLTQSERPAAARDAWRREIEAEQRLLDQRRPDTTQSTVSRLRWHGLRAELLAGADEAGLLDSIDALTDANPQAAERVLVAALEWIVQAGAEAALDRILQARRQLLNTKRGLYLAAMVRDRQGRDRQTAELAEAAFQAPPTAGANGFGGPDAVIDGRVDDARWLAEQGQADWAHREYASAAEQTPPVSLNAVWARWLLANSLRDHLRFEEANRTLRVAIDAIDADDASRLRYEDIRSDLPLVASLDELKAQVRYFTALRHRASGEEPSAIAALREAIELNNEDADYVIEFYRAAGAIAAEAGEEGSADPLLAEARGYVRDLADRLQQQIESDPEESLHYNHWAWLVANTEGDYAKAVRYSRKSLAIDPGNAGYLDTLGRCYFAVGDLDQAIVEQKKAVAGEPHVQVLHRQLAFFEAERAKVKNATDPQEQAKAVQPDPPGPAASPNEGAP